jgi:hypothetical protein
LLILSGALALPAGSAVLTASPADAHHSEPRPGIGVLSITPATVPSGGTTTVTISVSGAKECFLSAPEIPQENFPCESDTYERKITTPLNRSGRTRKVKARFYAIGSGSGSEVFEGSEGLRPRGINLYR